MRAKNARNRGYFSKPKSSGSTFKSNFSSVQKGMSKGTFLVSLGSLGSCDRALWVKYEDRKTNKIQQLDIYY